MKDLQAFKDASKIIRKLKRAGFDETYLVGGCVRDYLLNRIPKDFDIVTSAEPQEVQKLFPENLAIGESFGVIAVKEGDEFFEVATFREDGDYEDGRRPADVIFTQNVEEDVKRRDFTINGMLYDIDTDKVIDLVGGKDSLKWLTIQTIGNPLARFTEDKLRMLRAVRFATELNFKIEFNTKAAIKIMSKHILEVSMERISIELMKLMKSYNRVKGLLLLKECGLLKYIIPELDVLDMVDQNPEWHPEGNVWKHTLLVVEYLGIQVPEALPHVVWATLFHDVGKTNTFGLYPKVVNGVEQLVIGAHGHDKEGKELTEIILKRLKMTNDFTEDVCSLVGDHMKFRVIPKMKKSKLKRLVAKQYKTEVFNVKDRGYILDLKNLTLADSLGSIYQKESDLTGTLAPIMQCMEYINNIPEGEEIIKPENKLITGKDLIARGLKPGKLFGEIIRVVEEAQLNDKISTKEEANVLVDAFLSVKEQLLYEKGADDIGYNFIYKQFLKNKITINEKYFKSYTSNVAIGMLRDQHNIFVKENNLPSYLFWKEV